MTNWPRAKLKYVASLSYGSSLPHDPPPEGIFRVYGSNGPFSSYSKANTQGPAIIVGRKGSYGKVNWSEKPCFASDTTFFIDGSTTRNNLRWVYWLLQTLHLDEGSDEAAVPGLNQDTAYSKDVFLPPIHQQRAIADYLDRETAQINALISTKEQLAVLLAEKRHALINRSVSRGLEPNVPLRNSGIPWLGEIPAHWKVTRLKFAGRIQTGLALGKRYQARSVVEYPYLRVANVQDGFLDLSDVKTVFVPEQEARSCLLSKGDVLMNEGGDADKLGRGAVWTGEIAPCLHQNHVFAVRARDISPAWLALWISSDYAKAYFESRSKQSTNLASISATNLMEIPLLQPPEKEQSAIVDAVHNDIRKIDAMFSAIEDTVNLFKERRSAHIAAAVTGLIDVGLAT